MCVPFAFCFVQFSLFYYNFSLKCVFFLYFCGFLNLLSYSSSFSLVLQHNWYIVYKLILLTDNYSVFFMFIRFLKIPLYSHTKITTVKNIQYQYNICLFQLCLSKVFFLFQRILPAILKSYLGLTVILHYLQVLSNCP